MEPQDWNVKGGIAENIEVSFVGPFKCRIGGGTDFVVDSLEYKYVVGIG